MIRVSPAKVSSQEHTSRKHGLPPVDHRQSKKPRLSNSQRSQDGAKLHRTADRKDEKALLDELMAGLDASMFDMPPSSPAVSQKVASQGRVQRPSPLRSERDQTIAVDGSKGQRRSYDQLRRASPAKNKENASHGRPQASHRPGAKIKTERDFQSKWATSPTKAKGEARDLTSPAATIKVEAIPIPPPPVIDIPVEAEVKKEIKDELENFDDELFAFDFEGVDFDAIDGDISAMSEAKIRYPIINPPVPPPPTGYSATPWIRGKVKAVMTGLRFADGKVPPITALEAAGALDGSSARTNSIPGLTVIVKVKDLEQMRVIHLKERWADLPLRCDDIINVISPQLSSADPGPIVISFKNPLTFVIHHPDVMLTMTSISNAMPCPRKPILQSLVKMPGPVSKPMLYGNMLHGLLQSALQERDFSIDATRRRLDEDLRKETTRIDLWGTDLGVEDVRLEVGAKAGQGFEAFAQKWVGARVKDEGALHAEQGEKPSMLAINGLHDIEEDIWSPKWGLKGKVDASVQVLLQRPGEVEPTEFVAPLEIKTGRSVGMMAHRAQTMLYTLLMEDRYGIPIPAGLLYYSQLDSVLRVEARVNEIRALITARNELAHYLAKERSIDDVSPIIGSQEGNQNDIETFLPPTIDNPRECKTCYTKDTCMLYRKTIDQVPADPDDPIFELYDEKTGHLTPKDVEFFRKWENLLTVEAQDMVKFRSQLWTMTSAEREKSGRCLSDMVIVTMSDDRGQSLSKIHRHSYTFARAPHASTQSRNNLLSGHISAGDPVSISIEPDLICMWRGFVLALTPSDITIGLTYKIDTHALLARTAHRGYKMDGDKVVFRIDKDEMAAGLLKMRANLASLFVENGSENLRKLVVDHHTPRFDSYDKPTAEEVPKSFNADQRKAMEAVLSAQDYALILGMPGTGKTTTIAEIIKTLVERGKTVLLTSYTHSAVDTILMKLLNSELGLLRLGNVDKVHPDVRHLTLEGQPSASMEDLDQRLMSPPVVAATCLSVDHPLFFRRRFDYCIVDEASQITLPTCIGPLRLADKFVLVGDHFQLPPIVRNVDAKRGGLDVSLFRTLSDAHPAAVTDLSYQYRMNEDIMLLSNKLIYEGKLKCGSDEVARRGLKLEGKSCEEIYGSACVKPCWVQDLMDPSVKAVFVDTDRVPAKDSRLGNLVQNDIEAAMVHQLARAMTVSGLKERDLAVITPYRQQIKLLSGLFIDMPKVEILTADKSQGRDKECILISLVRSNTEGNIGDLLKDWRRINVSFTRAKAKLVIFGSRSTLGGDKLLKEFLGLMESKEWIYKLPAGADVVHGSVGEVKVESWAVKAEEGDKGAGGKGDMADKVDKGKRVASGFMASKYLAKDVLADLA